MPLTNWLLWDRLREFTRANRIYQQERIFQDQPALDRIQTGGDLLGNTQHAILDQTTVQLHRLNRYRDYAMMDQTGEVSLALDLYAEEIALYDPEHKHTLIIRANNRRIKEELEDLFFNTLQVDRMIRPLARYLCKYGDFASELIPTRDRKGIAALRFLRIFNLSRIETKHGDLVGFFYNDEVDPEPIFLHPWACMHLRLTDFEEVFAPFGKSVLEGGRKAWQQLKLMEDAALVYRIVRAPERRKFKIPVGQIPPKEVPEYMQAIARMFKRQRFYNQATATFDEKYSPLIQEDDFFLPVRPDGTGPDIDTLAGAENLDQIADIEYFKKKMIAPMKIPFARVGIGDKAGEPNGKSLSQSHSEFAKAVRWIQVEIALGLTKVAIAHLAMRGYSAEDVSGFELNLASSSALEDLYRMETWQTRAGVMSALKEIGWFPKEWIVTRFTDLSPDEIQELRDQQDEESGVGGLGGGSGLLGGGDDDIFEELGDAADLEDSGEELGGSDDSGPANLGDLDDDIEVADDIGSKMEDFDPDEKRLLTEFANQQRRESRYEFTKAQFERKNTIQSVSQYLLSTNEFDGLPGTEIKKPLVESVVEKDDFEEAKAMVLESIRNSRVPQLDISEMEITDADIPI